MSQPLSVEAPAVVGAAFGGGYYAGLIRIGEAIHALIVAPKALGETIAAWDDSDEPDEIPGACSYFDGLANTTAMAEADLRLVVATLADLMGELPDDLVDVMGWRDEIDAGMLAYGEDVDWLLKRLPDMSGDQLGVLVTLFALSHAPVVTLTGNAAQAKRALAERYGGDVLNPEGEGSQQTDNAGGAGEQQQSDKAGTAGQAHDPDRCPNTGDMFVC